MKKLFVVMLIVTCSSVFADYNNGYKKGVNPNVPRQDSWSYDRNNPGRSQYGQYGFQNGYQNTPSRYDFNNGDNGYSDGSRGWSNWSNWSNWRGNRYADGRGNFQGGAPIGRCPADNGYDDDMYAEPNGDTWTSDPYQQDNYPRNLQRDRNVQRRSWNY